MTKAIESAASLRWRGIGPHRGGRVGAVIGHPTEKMTFYFGASGGGVYRTTNGGISWENISDGFMKTASVGAMAISQSDPAVLYVGMGESAIRGNVSFGDGVYKSTDGGRTFRAIGLADTRHISRIRIHPHNPDVAYVAALGHAFGPNHERGVFRTEDGGRTFTQVLQRDEYTGAIDLAMDPNDPRTLYAAMWQVQRGPNFLTSGGPGSGLFKTTDGGETFVELSQNPGFPTGVLGRIGVAVSTTRPGRVFALVEAKDGGVYRSEDGGATWALVSDSRHLRSRAWYYTNIFTDPCDSETVVVLNNFYWKSTDGGRTFSAVGTPHPDHHDLWIDPQDPQRMIHGNDGGACVSFDGGATWSTIYNQATAEFYHVTTDTRFPYRVYGAQQDNTTLTVPSRSDNAGISSREWYDVGGAESGYIAVRPDNPDIVFAGSSGGGEGGRLTRYDHRIRQRRDVSPWPERTAGMAAEDYTYRFQWTSPILISPHDPNVLYFAGNRIFRSYDDGASWEIVSPDLTRNDKEKQRPSGGPITKDHTGVEVYCTVFALAESPLQKGLLWAGSDDGLIHLSRDGGTQWENITPPVGTLPEWALISIIEPSHRDAGTAYVAATRYRHDDTAPYLLVTRDYGKTWQSITEGIRQGDYTRVVREDPQCPGLLFAGTETGIHVSLDDGQSWQSLQLNLPVVSIHDLAIRDGDLVAATHGRSFWILDDITPLQQLAADAEVHGLRLFAPKPTVRMHSDSFLLMAQEQEMDHPTDIIELPAGTSYIMKRKASRGEAAEFLNAGQNAPTGVMFRYMLDEESEGELTLTIRDSRGEVVRTFSSSGEGDAALPKGRGAHRFSWDMKYEDALKLEDGPGRVMLAPQAVPSSFEAELAADGRTSAQRFEILKDPRVGTSQDDLERQFAFILEVRDLVSAVHAAIRRIRTLRSEMNEWISRAAGHAQAGSLKELGDAALSRLGSIEEALTQVNIKSPQDEVGFPPGLNAQVAYLGHVAASADAAPTKQTYDAFAQLKTRAEAQLSQMKEAIAGEVQAFGTMLNDMHIPLLSTQE